MLHPRPFVLLAALAALLPTVCGGAPVAGDGPSVVQDEEPTSLALFDGRSLEGWSGDPRFWSVRDGAIVGESTADHPCSRTTYLIREGVVAADFELSFSFRITGGNSGLHFRSYRGPGDDPWDVGGYQADLEDGPNWTGCLYEQYGRAVFAQRGQSLVARKGTAPEVTTFADGAALLATVAAGEWNEYTVRAVGPRIELAINGVKMCEVEDLDPAHARRSGLFAFQMHAGPPMRIELRDVRFLDLGGDVTDEPSPFSEPLLHDVEIVEIAEDPRDEAKYSDVVRDEATGELDWKYEPLWIWRNADPQPYEEAWFAKSFDVTGRVLGATVWASCDNELELFLNGERVAVGEDWMRPVQVQVGPHLVQGRNVVAAWGRNETGPAAFWFELVVEHPDDRMARYLTDETWSCADREFDGWTDAENAAGAWGAPTSFGPLGTGVWGAPQGTSDGTPSRALPPEELELLPGFRAELVYSVPRREQGSWVSMTFDDRGRVIASDQYGELYRVTLANGAASAVEKLDVALGEAQGLLHAFGSLYVVVSGAGKYESGLYRLTDTTGDDRYDTTELLKKLDGWGEHGPHGIVAGPDGESLYLVAGNHVELPDDIATYRVPPVWGEDLLLPRIDDPNGHAVGRMAPGAWVVRMNPDGTDWELVAAGMRNPYDLAFDENGELFTFDADMEWDTGLPWYRPTRVLHLVSGAEFGWRHGSGKWPDYYPDSLPSVVDVGLSSPTGICFGTKTSFPDVYRRALFVADWAYGTIYAVHMYGRGASFGGVVEPFAVGKPLPLTDLEPGPDGALYALTGGRRLQSGLYRIVWEGAAEPTPTVEIPPLDSRHERALELRRMLDVCHVSGLHDDAPEAMLDAITYDYDRFVHFSMRTVLERVDPARWSGIALAEETPTGLIHAMLALVRVGGPEYAPRILDALARLDLTTLDEETLLTALRVYGLVLIRHGDPDDERKRAMVERFDALYPSGADRVDRELAQLLVRLEAPGVVAKTLRRMARAATQEEEIHYLTTLRTLRAGWTLPQRETYFRFLDERVPHYRGGVSLQRYVERIREDAVATLSAEEHAALRPLLESPDRHVATRAARRPAAFVRAWELDEVLALLPRTTKGRSFEGGTAAVNKATCTNCHRIAGRGGAVGPDLTGVANRMSPRELVETIFAPSSVISDQYQDTELWMTDGELLVGRLGPERDGRIGLHTVPPDEEDLEVPVDEIEELRPHPLSRMPERLLDVLTEEEVIELLSYVLAGGDPEAAAYSQSEDD